MFPSAWIQAILFTCAAWGVATPVDSRWRGPVLRSPTAGHRADNYGVLTMSDKAEAAKMALEGLDMGYRVIAAKLNETIARSRCKVRLECDPVRRGDSMLQARTMLIRSLPVLAPLAVHSDEVYWVAPWTLGYLSGMPGPKSDTAEWLTLLRLSRDSLADEAAFAFLQEQFKAENWYVSEWKERVIDPVEEHHKGFRRWILSTCPTSDIDDDTQTAIELCRAWCRLDHDQGGPSESQAAFLRALIDLHGEAIAEDLELRIGARWSDCRNAAHSRALRINSRASAEEWEVVEVNQTFKLRLKQRA